MKRVHFMDRRGDEYTFLQYNTGDVKITKKSAPKIKHGRCIFEVNIGDEAAVRLRGFLGGGT